MTSIGAFPGFKSLGDPNPYEALFYMALEQHGFSWWGECNPWQCDHTGHWPDIVHLHWPELLWTNRPPALIRQLRRLPGGWGAYDRARPLIDRIQMERLMRILRRAKARGSKIVWTLHNVMPHEGASSADLEGYRTLTSLADLCIAHSDIGVGEFETLYGRLERVVVMPMGNYAGVYPPARPREQVLESFGLSAHAPTVCCLGNIRHYKGIDIALEAMRKLEGRVQLVIAGKPIRGFDTSALSRRIGEMEGVVFRPEFVDNQLYSDLTQACDATLLPYRQITGSGVLLASITLGTGVVASDLPYFREVLDGHEGAGRLFERDSPDALADALQSYIAVPLETRRSAALSLSTKYDWGAIIKSVASQLGTICTGSNVSNVGQGS